MNPGGAGACAHCGEPLAGHEIVRRAVGGASHDYCCLGCAFLAEQIQRAAAPASAERPAVPVQGTCGQIEVRGMVCAACALLLEDRLRRTPGVLAAHVDFVARRAMVVYDPARAAVAGLAQVVERTGYRVPTADTAREERRAARVELLRVLLAWLAMMQVMMLAMPSYLARPGEIAPAIEQMLRIAQLVLTAPVALFCAAPFWRAAASQLRTGAVGMDVPVALGLAGALAASAWATVQGRGAVYFDSVTMFTAFLLSVRWWQLRALTRAAAQFDAAAQAARPRAQRLRAYPQDWTADEVAADALAEGDHVLVRAGDVVPADGRVAEGATALSQAWISGEFAPVPRGPGDRVLAGSLNLGAPFVMRVRQAGDATSLAALQRMVVGAAGDRPRSTDLAQRVAARFALAVLAAAGVTAIAWLAIDPALAPRAAIAVLVVTCPCALSLAAPLAMTVAQARLASGGVLLLRTGALEALARIDTVALDKTGTITEDAPVLEAITVHGSLDESSALALAAALDAVSRHPFARAIAQAAQARGLALPGVQGAIEHPGAGMEGEIAGQRYRLGRADFVRELSAASGDPADTPPSPDGSTVVLGGTRGLVARLHFSEALRPGATQLLQSLHRDGLHTLLVSGDSEAAVQSVARRWRGEVAGAVPLQVHAGQSPAGKCALIEALQAEGRRVAMVGDGINDAPVLARADASIALASGAHQAQVRADVLVEGARLDALRGVFALARRALGVARQNLAWALAYNVVMVPLAALGLLAPWIAASGMAASSVVVLANSLRLRADPGN